MSSSFIPILYLSSLFLYLFKVSVGMLNSPMGAEESIALTISTPAMAATGLIKLFGLRIWTLDCSAHTYIIFMFLSAGLGASYSD